MTPPAEGERARAQCAAEIVLPEDRTFSCVMDDDHEGIHTFRMNSEGVTRLTAALRAPQPRGLTGDAIREACAKIADEAKVTGPADARDHVDDANDAACAAIAERIRALDLSAIEGAAAAGEREVLTRAEDFIHRLRLATDRNQAWELCDDAILGPLHRCLVDALAPASPRSAAPEDK